MPLRASLAALAIAIGACGDAASPQLLGTYSLRVVNDSRLPAIIFDGGDLLIAVSGSDVILEPDSTFLHATRYTITSATGVASQSDTVRGSFSLVGDKIMAAPSQGTSYVLVWEGVGLVHYAEGLTYRYRK